MAHWTERSIKNYVFKIADDFIVQLEDKMEEEDISREDFMAMLEVSKGRISQILNNPGDMTLAGMVCIFSHRCFS